MNETLPTFSLVIETENLEVSDLQHLERSLRSLRMQTFPLAKAQEIILVDTGVLAREILEKSCAPYGQIQIVSTPGEHDYFKVKMFGFPYTTGEVVLFADCDCSYDPDWLRNMLQPFQDPAIQVVTGETYHRIRNPYDLAVALAWVLEPYSLENELKPVRVYMANTMAFRRQVLLRHPLQGSRQFMRVGQIEHGEELAAGGIVIWQQPKARVDHEVPGLNTIFGRMYGAGQDVHFISKRKINPLGKKDLWRTRFFRLLHKIKLTFEYDRNSIYYFPFAMPLILVLIGTYLAGYFFGRALDLHAEDEN